MRVQRTLLLAVSVVLGATLSQLRAVPADDDDLPSLPSGLIARYRRADGGAEVIRIEAVPRLFGDAVHPSMGGAFEASWSGRIVVADGSYTFSLTPCSLEDVTLTIAGKAVRPGAPVRLAYGLHPFILRGTHRKGPLALGLWWEGPKFVREPVPPRIFAHEPADETASLHKQQQADRGAVLAQALGCCHCHTGASPSAFDRLLTPEQVLPGPRLDKLGGRVRPGWVAAWLASPHAQRPDARMPALFEDMPSDREAIQTITAFLTQGKDDVPRPSGNAAKGRKLFESAGCAACHHQASRERKRPQEHDRTQAPALVGLGAKWTTQGLADFVHHPLATREHGRMPDFGFTAQEASDLAAWLLSDRDAGTPPAPPPAPTAEQLRRQWQALGEDAVTLNALPQKQRLAAVALRQMAALRCTSCHAVGDDAPVPAKAPAAPLLTGLAAHKRERGCMAKDVGRAPRFDLSEPECTALSNWLARLRADVAPSMAETVRIDLHLYQCTACHRNEGTGGDSLVAALGGPAAARFRTPPDLTGVGTRLRADRLIGYARRGAGAHPLRPWLGARMPGFGDRGARLALGLLAHDTGAPADLAAWWREAQRPAPPAPVAPPNHIEMARFLVSARGLACVNCHSLNGSQSAAVPDPTTRGPDLGLVAGHLRPEYFRRLLRDPARIFPGTTMPQMVGPDNVLPLPGFEKLGAALPIEAIWQYLSLGAEAPPPLAPDAGTLPVRRGAPPVVQRGPVVVRDRVFGRGVALGFADGSLLFDADLLRPVAAWNGGFLASNVDKYFGYSWRPAAEAELLDDWAPRLVHRSTDGRPWRTAPLPAETDANDGTRFDGYLIGPASVTFRYHLLLEGHRVPVRQELRVVRRPQWQGHVSDVHVENLRAPSRLGLLLPAAAERQYLSAKGSKPDGPKGATAVLFSAAGRAHLVRLAGAGAGWETGAGSELVAVFGDATDDRSLTLRSESWTFTGPGQPTEAQIASLFTPTTEAPVPTPPAPSAPIPAPPAVLADDGKPFAYRIEPIAGPSGWRPSGATIATDGTVYALDMSPGRVYRACYADFTSPKWELYAAGLNHPLGLATLEGRLFVGQRPEVTEIIAQKRAAMAAEYRSLTGGPWPLGNGYHEYLFGPTVGHDGQLYIGLNCGHFWPHGGATRRGRYKGAIVRIDPRTGKLTEVARGCRVPNGVTRGPSGTMVFLDNQGDWVPVCKLCVLHEGRFYGHPENEADKLPPSKAPEGQAACWLPYEHVKSASGPATDETGGRFGPFAGQVFFGDVGYGANRGLYRVALEKVGGDWQGACFRFLDDQPLGVQGLTFAPDGQLLAACLTSGLLRIRFGGKTPMEMHHVALRPGGKGFIVHFTRPLDDGAVMPADIQVRRWHYRYSGDYGSPPIDEKAVIVTKSEVSADRKRITLTLPVETYPGGMVYHLLLPPLESADGESLAHREAWYTVQRIEPE